VDKTVSSKTVTENEANMETTDEEIRKYSEFLIFEQCGNKSRRKIETGR
jgi:hypothetical protein